MVSNQDQPGLSATFVPGGFDDYYMPTPAPEIQAPLPQRHMPEVPDQMQENLANLELEGAGPGQSFPQRKQPPQNSIQAYHHPASVPDSQAVNLQFASSEYSQHSYSGELPHFSPFPKLINRPANIPPSDDEKEGILESARMPVLNSNDPEMQLAWAQDALAYVAAAQTYDERLAENRPARSVTPAVEHQLRVDAVNIVSFLAEQHHPKAEFMKGMWLEFGNFGWRQDKREAFRSYARAAEKGYSRAEYRMGMQFEQNHDPVKALTHYQRGAATGDSASNYRLGMMTLMGQMGQQQDHAKGIDMLRKAAEQADENAPQGAYVLGMIQARELPQVSVPESILPYSEVEARMNIEKAAFLGFAKAQLKMGSAYEVCSLGCDFNPALSMHYNALAARQGEAEAEMAISKWFLCGYENIFPKNEELAYEYALRAAQSGLPTAQFALGYFNEIGMHVSVNLNNARDWYEKAARNGNDEAINRVEDLQNSQFLSKKQHENVAVSKIKSQYGSMKGKRPDRLRAQAPMLPTVTDEQTEFGAYGALQRPGSSGRAGGRSTVPPRASSMTPYPVADGPPVISGPPRPATVTPYPMSNGPPNVGPLRPSRMGEFASEQRPHSAAPAQGHYSSGSAFNINPNIYDQRPGTNAYDNPPQGDPNLPRPATTVGDLGNGRGGRPPYQHTQSVPVDYGRAASGQHSGQGPALPQKSDVGYQGLGRRPSPSLSPNNMRPLPGMNDIGYIAPLQTKVVHDGSMPAANRPPRGDSRVQGRSRITPSGARPPRTDSAPSPAPVPVPNTVNATQPPRKTINKPQPHQSVAPAKKQGGGKGPKTFEEMGVPKTEDKSDCILM